MCRSHTKISKTISIHSLRVEGDRRKPCSLYCLLYFNPLPPCGGRPCCGSAMWNFCSISIHSLRVEGDAVVLLQFLVHVEFQSTPSVWRETMSSTLSDTKTIVFQSTPSVWRETALACYYALWMLFQSTPSVWRETLALQMDNIKTERFQSTPSVWRETQLHSHAFQYKAISIHSLRVEGDIYILFY